MRINPGYIINKFFKMIHRPALRDCDIDKTAKVGAASNCIRVKMGRYSYMGVNNSVCDTKIGSFCSIASNCAIGGGNHKMNVVSTSPAFYAGHNILKKNFFDIFEESNRGVEIGNDVWIGEAVFIKDGVRIGTGAVIGAHSVVAKDVPPYAIFAGVPAKLLRYRFDENTIERLLESNWWNWTDERLEETAKYFTNTESFLRILTEREKA